MGSQILPNGIMLEENIQANASGTLQCSQDLYSYFIATLRSKGKKIEFD